MSDVKIDEEADLKIEKTEEDEKDIQKACIKYIDKIKLKSKKVLFEYQKNIAKECIMIETSGGRRKRKSAIIRSPGMIVNLPVGTGKTMTTCAYLKAMIRRSKQKYEYEQTVYDSNPYTCVTYKDIHKVDIDTMILCSPTIIYQWAEHLDDMKIKYTLITVPSDFKDKNMFLGRVVLISTKQYKEFVKVQHINVIYRFIYDEPDTCYIAGINIECKFCIIITGTPEQLFSARKKNSHAHTIRKIFGDVDKSLLYTCDPNDIKIPQVEVVEEKHICCGRNITLYRGILEGDAYDAIACGDEKRAIEILKVPGQKCTNLADAIGARFDHNEEKYGKYDTEHTKNKLEDIRSKRILLAKRQERIDQLNDTQCGKCFLNLADYICICGVLTCLSCSGNECRGCVMKLSYIWGVKEVILQKKYTMFEPNLIKMIHSYLPPVKLPIPGNDYVGEVCKIIRNGLSSSHYLSGHAPSSHSPSSRKKFLIFSYYNMSSITRGLDNDNIPYGVIEGRVSNRQKYIDAFRDNSLNVLFFKDKENMAGTDLPEATDIIISHDMTDDMVEQCVARAKRLGCTHKITVHKFITGSIKNIDM